MTRRRKTAGCRYYLQYLAVNGHGHPTPAGLRRLSRHLDLSTAFLRQRIRNYLAS